MKLVKYSRRPNVSIFDDMNLLFNQLGRWPAFGYPAIQRNWAPAFDIRETDEAYSFEAALPGLSKKDIDVSVRDGILSISGEREEQETLKGETVHTTELRRGSFSRSFSFPSEVDEENVDARYKDGMLTISVKKLTPVEPDRKKIAVK